MTTTDHRIIPDAEASPGENLARVFGNSQTASTAGNRFMCHEADLIAVALRELHQHQAAITWLLGHAEGDDDEGDLHRTMRGTDVSRAVLRQHAGEYLDQL